jgi:hypothetical protein
MTFPLEGLGYQPAGLGREMSGFNYEASIAYLGSTNCCSPLTSTHWFTAVQLMLVPPTGIRIIRAVLIDVQRKKS